MSQTEAISPVQEMKRSLKFIMEQVSDWKDSYGSREKITRACDAIWNDLDRLPVAPDVSSSAPVTLHLPDGCRATLTVVGTHAVLKINGGSE